MSMYKYIQNILATYIRLHILNINRYMHAQGILQKHNYTYPYTKRFAIQYYTCAYFEY